MRLAGRSVVTVATDRASCTRAGRGSNFSLRKGLRPYSQILKTFTGNTVCHL